MNRFFRSLKTKLTIVIILVALPGLLAIVYFSLLAREYALDSALERATKTVEITTTFQTLLINRTKNFLQNLATFPEVMTPNSPECSAYLTDVIKIKDIYANIGIVQLDGNLLCSAKPFNVPVNISDRSYFQHTLTNKSFAIGGYQLDRASGVTTINFAYPVIDPNSDKIVGVAVAAISLNWWSKQLSESHLPKHAVAYITDLQQNIIASFPVKDELLGTPVDEVQPNLKAYQFESHPNIKTFLSSDQHLKVFVERPLFTDDKRVTLSVGIPFETKLSDINETLLSTSLVLILIVVLMFLVATWGIKKSLLTPLNILLKSTKKLEAGEEIGCLSPIGASELYDLQTHFISMAKTRLDAENRLKHSQQALQKSEDLHLSHIRNTPLGCISWDKDFVCTSWNKSAENIFGYKSHEAIGQHALKLIVEPQLRSNINKLYDLILTQKGGSFVSNENITKSGESLVCEWHNTIIQSENGSLIGVTSLVQDITKNKKVEAQLTLAASVFSQANEGIIITDTTGTIIEVNNSFVEITGYSREEVIGKNPNILKSNQQSQEFYRQLWKSINENDSWSGEVWNKRKNNEIYPQLLTISAVYDDDKKLKNYVAIFTDISEIKEKQNQLEHMAHFDVLTDLPNRSLLADRLNQSILFSKRSKTQVAIVFLDLDGFKEINDKHGHSVGDELLVVFADRLKDILREHDTLSRYGGDEFVIVLSELESNQDFHPIVERMLNAASSPFTLGRHVLKLSASIGVTVYPCDHTDAEQLIRHADQAMYIAKQKGKNCYHVFDIESEDAITNHHVILQNIAAALKKREFVLFYQPKVNMATGEIIGLEALIRWQHSTRGLLSPYEFLPFIENHQLGIEIGEWVIEEALKQLNMGDKTSTQLPISVNISALQIQQHDFTERLESLLSAYPNVAPANLQIEILETSEIGDLDRVSERMKNCLKFGVSFAIDDFGTGYSSLTYLRRLPVDVIKIDQTFIRDMLEDPEDRAIVEGIIALAKSFNRAVIAEGVETIRHGSMLLQMGCELAQGYGIARPMPAEQLGEWVKSWTPDIEWRNQKTSNKS
ncbi:MAG: EAL domain-containing protein [Paraglaciecola sp.]|uniref:EAL domain-containing protein n=1 Tax=Paraglaciecola sp. TaxID=1920173 RepID=UPI003298DF73